MAIKLTNKPTIVLVTGNRVDQKQANQVYQKLRLLFEKDIALISDLFRHFNSAQKALTASQWQTLQQQGLTQSHGTVSLFVQNMVNAMFYMDGNEIRIRNPYK